MGQDQTSGSRSNFWSAAFDIRGSALPRAARSNNPKSASKKSHYQSKVFQGSKRTKAGRAEKRGRASINMKSLMSLVHLVLNF